MLILAQDGIVDDSSYPTEKLLKTAMLSTPDLIRTLAPC